MSTPTLPTDHEEYEALAVAWAVDALEPADLAIFEAHRDGCERCTRAAYAALETAAELAYGVLDASPPPRLRERVLAAALPHQPNGQPPARFETGALEGRRPDSGPASSEEADRSDDQPESRSNGRRALRDEAAGRRALRGEVGRRPKRAGPGRVVRGLRGSRRLVYALAAAVLAAGSAITTWEVTRPAPVTDRVVALSAANGTVATVVAHRHGADVVTDVLPPNTGRGTAYYLWGVPAEDGGTPQVVGTFQVTASGLHSYPLRLTRSLDGYPVLAISEEKADSTPSAPGKVLGKGALGG